MTLIICPWSETGPVTEHSCHVVITNWMQNKYVNPFLRTPCWDASHIPVQLLHIVQSVTRTSVILDTSAATCFKTMNFSPCLGQTHVHSMYVYHNKSLKINLPTSSVSISVPHCLELQALLLCLLVLAPRYGCFLQSRLQTESGRAAEYRRLASTQESCSW